MNELRQLLRRVQDGLGEGFALCGGAITAATEAHPNEARLVATATARRKNEFLCGRAQAHRALRQLGCDTPVIGRAAAGAPLWPAGVAGSITHSRRYCAALAAKGAVCAAVGVDMTQTHRVKPRLWDKLFTRAELAGLANTPAHERQRHAAVLFSAKESAYKCLFPRYGKYIGFAQAQVDCKDGRQLVITISKPGYPSHISGTYACGDTHALTVALLPYGA